MASAGLVRSAINGLLRKSTTYSAPVVCKLSTVAIQQKHHSIKTAIKLYNNPICQSGVCRQYSVLAGAPRKPPPEEVEQRVFKVCQAYDKLSSAQLRLDSHFMNDLGLDSLDHVEVIMAMEDEFGFEIPDADAERLMRPQDIVQYVCDKEDVYE